MKPNVLPTSYGETAVATNEIDFDTIIYKLPILNKALVIWKLYSREVLLNHAEYIQNKQISRKEKSEKELCCYYIAC